MPGSPQHAIKVKDKNKADSKKGIKVHISVLYSRKESEDKTAVVSLWFDVAHLTDSLLEAIKVCQGDNGGRETIPLNNCQGKKGVFVVLSPSANVSVCQRVGSPRDAGQGDDV